MIAPGACAVFFPPRENFFAAVREALESPQRNAKLYTDGRRMAWLPKPARDWQRVNTIIVKEAS